jgi:ABC-type nitrate/sulfonate/bicarbonate transport system substrate-binding protein
LPGFVLAFLCFFAGYAAAAEREVRMAVTPAPDALVGVIGTQDYQDIYAKNGLAVQLNTLLWQDIPKALHEGKVDVAIGDLSTVIANNAKYPDLVYWYAVITYDDGFALQIRPDGKLKTASQLDTGRGTRDDAVMAAVRQLKGKTIIARAGGAGDMAVSMLARREGLHITNGPDSDIHVISYPVAEDGEKAFVAGEGDAYIGPVLQRTEASDSGMIEMLNGRDLSSTPMIGFITTRDYAAHHESELVDLLHGWFGVMNYVDTHRETAGKIVSDLLSHSGQGTMNIADFLKVWQGYERFMLTPQQADQAVLDPHSPDYWQTRASQCNEFYCSVDDTLPQPISAADVFLMEDAQKAYLARYGR